MPKAKTKTERLIDVLSYLEYGTISKIDAADKIKDLFGYKEELLPIEERKEAFRLSVLRYNNKYSGPTLDSFYKHWTETNKSGLMKFELQQTWSIAGRLATWLRQEKKFSIINNLKRKH